MDNGYGPSNIFIWATTKIVGKYEQAKSATWTMIDYNQYPFKFYPLDGVLEINIHNI